MVICGQTNDFKLLTLHRIMNRRKKDVACENLEHSTDEPDLKIIKAARLDSLKNMFFTVYSIVSDEEIWRRCQNLDDSSVDDYRCGRCGDYGDGGCCSQAGQFHRCDTCNKWEELCKCEQPNIDKEKYTLCSNCWKKKVLCFCKEPNFRFF